MAKSLDGPARKNLLRIAGAALLCVFATAASADTWQAGVARIRITPQQPMWLSGYAARSGPATGKLTDLWAKALVLKDHRDKHVVLVTMDLIGIDRELAREICRRAERALVRQQESGAAIQPTIPAYINRLSDLLWLCGRKLEHDAGITGSLREATGKTGNRFSRAW